MKRPSIVKKQSVSIPLKQGRCSYKYVRQLNLLFLGLNPFKTGKMFLPEIEENTVFLFASQSLQNREDVPTVKKAKGDMIVGLNPFKTGKMFLLQMPFPFKCLVKSLNPFKTGKMFLPT